LKIRPIVDFQVEESSPKTHFVPDIPRTQGNFTGEFYDIVARASNNAPLFIDPDPLISSHIPKTGQVDIFMKPSDLQLLELINVDEDAGTIHFKNRRMLFLDADALGFLRKEMIESLGRDQARRLLMRFGYARGYRNALAMRQWFNWKSDEDLWIAGAKLHGLEGSVKVNPIHAEIDRENGICEVVAEWLNSYEADQHLKHLGLSDVPVCWTLTGYASGYTSAVLGRDMFYIEHECVGRGDPRCLVRGSSKVDEESSVVRLALEQKLLEGKDFWKEIERISSERTELNELIEQLERHSLEIVQKEARVRELESQVIYLQETINEPYNVEELIGVSPGFRRVMTDIDQVASSDATVLISGETGTGKELVARAIQARSARKSRPLVIVNCAALPAGLVESELFGHEKGAFTGAVQRKLGRFEIANGATIFLDEIGELPLETQSKFLRILQQGEFERVGGTQTIKVEARVLAATNQSLEKLVAEGKFRADLFYRLNVFPIRMPPLRERVDDIRLLTNYFAQKFRARFNKKNISSIDQQSMNRLLQYSWPGNVRELEHVIERAVLLATGDVLKINLPLSENEIMSVGAVSSDGSQELVTLDEMERSYIREVLRNTGGVIAGKGGAAEILGLPPSTLRSRMKKLGVH
jgi:two-component system response regulator HydG